MFAGENFDCEILYDYKTALYYYGTIKPIRGRDVRPIGNRRKDYAQIIDHSDYADPHVSCKLYDTEVVKFYKDGRIVINSWSSQTTANFISECTPFNAGLKKDKLYVEADGKYYIGSELTFRRGADRKWEIEGDEMQTKIVINRERSKPVIAMMNQRLKPLRALLNAMNPTGALRVEFEKNSTGIDVKGAAHLLTHGLQPERFDAWYLSRSMDYKREWNQAASKFEEGFFVNHKKVDGWLRKELYEEFGVYDEVPLGRGVLPD